MKFLLFIDLNAVIECVEPKFFGQIGVSLFEQFDADSNRLITIRNFQQQNVCVVNTVF